MITLFYTLRRALRRFLLPGILAFVFSISYVPLPRSAPAVRNHDTGQSFLPDYGHTLVAAHRIGKGNAPENTLMAVRACLESDAAPDIIETDLQCTRDGELVLFHDLYLDDRTNAVEAFGRRKVTVFSRTYAELRELNMGETFAVKTGADTVTYPYAGLRGDAIPDDLRIMKIADVFDYVEANAPGRFRYTVEIKYPSPWAALMLNRLYKILHERQLESRVIVASYWPDVGNLIDVFYSGKLMRSANPLEIIELYGCFRRGTDLSREKLPYMALQMPYYWRHGEKLLFGNLGTTEFIDYAHRCGLSVQYFTVNKREDMQDLVRGGADVLMTDHPERAFDEIRKTVLFEEETS
ncbi:MAG: hypothetical protein IJT41_03990 [Clostridia bacterium]|nr:hypothetical protein [Clostridia bacterium]